LDSGNWIRTINLTKKTSLKIATKITVGISKEEKVKEKI
jgi:hypothetical protein